MTSNKDFINALINDANADITSCLGKHGIDVKAEIFSYSGFDVRHLADLIAGKSNQDWNLIANAVAIGYMRGNMHQTALTRTSPEGQAKIREINGLLGIVLKKKGATESPGRDTITYTRVGAVFPFMVCELLHKHSKDSKAGIPIRMVPDPAGLGIANLPACMHFMHFGSILAAGPPVDASGVHYVKEVLTFASAAWVWSFLQQIVKDPERRTPAVALQQVRVMANHELCVGGVNWYEKWEILTKTGNGILLHSETIKVCNKFCDMMGVSHPTANA